MRYIGRTQTSTIVQVDADQNSYINIKSFGAAGLDRYLEGRVRGLNDNGLIINIGSILEYPQLEEDYFQIGQELYAFFYLDTSNPPPSEYDGIFTNIGTPQAFGSVVDAGIETSRTLRYYVYPFNPSTGKFSPYSSTFTLPNVYRDPQTQFDEDNFVQITLTRDSSNWLPVIYRQWGDQPIKFLGIPGNNAFGSNTTITFSDRGPAQIPIWDETRLNNKTFSPELFENIISIPSGSSITAKTIIVKRRLKIVNRTLSGIIECRDAGSPTADFSELDDTTIKVRFKFDDTKAIQDSLDFAARNNIKDIFIPAGTYSVRNLKFSGAEEAREYSGLIIRGSGSSSVLKRMPTHVNSIGQFGFIGILGSGVTNRIENITVRDIAFDGNKTEVFSLRPPENDVYGIGDKYNDALALEYTDAINVYNCSFYNGAGSALYVLNSEKISFNNNRVFELSKPYEINISPLKIRESSRIIAQGNLFQNCSGAVDFTGIDSSLINNNIVDNCGETGLRLNASDNWNAQGNLTLNESGSIVRSIDLYQNEYSRASLTIKRGVVMASTYFTVTDAQLPVEIAEGSIRARVYPLNPNYQIITSGTAEYLQVVEAKEQTDAGIFAVTAPVATINSGSGGSNQGLKIKGTNDYALLDADNPVVANRNYGYAYKITATVRLGNFPISRIIADPDNSDQVRIYLKNSADLLQLNFFAGGNASNSSISTSGVRIAGTPLASWTDGTPFTVLGIDSTNSYIRIGTPASVSNKFASGTEEYAIRAGNLNIIQNNYFIADGNIYVSD